MNDRSVLSEETKLRINAELKRASSRLAMAETFQKFILTASEEGLSLFGSDATISTKDHASASSLRSLNPPSASELLTEYKLLANYVGGLAESSPIPRKSVRTQFR